MVQTGLMTDWKTVIEKTQVTNLYIYTVKVIIIVADDIISYSNECNYAKSLNFLTVHVF